MKYFLPWTWKRFFRLETPLTDQTLTDSARVAVVTLNRCTQPHEDLDEAKPGPQPCHAVLWIRRITLTARNHFIRDNWVYRTADTARLAYLAFRKFHRQAGQEGAARRLEAAAAHSAPLSGAQ